jgi:hypothetical protein
MPLLGDLAEECDGAALVIRVYQVRRFGVAPPMANAGV